jgi:hypothetical protein
MSTIPQNSGRRSLPAPYTRAYQPVREYYHSFLSSFSLKIIARPYPATRLIPASSDPIGGTADTAMSAIEASLAALEEASALAGSIPFIAPVAGLLLQALTMRDASVPLLLQ